MKENFKKVKLKHRACVLQKIILNTKNGYKGGKNGPESI